MKVRKKTRQAEECKNGDYDNNQVEDELNLSQKGVSGSPSSLSASPCHDYDDGDECHNDYDGGGAKMATVIMRK